MLFFIFTSKLVSKIAARFRVLVRAKIHALLPPLIAFCSQTFYIYSSIRLGEMRVRGKLRFQSRALTPCGLIPHAASPSSS
jgi:hypothetical protein